MKTKMMGSAALGGAIAAAMVVAVYEGNVVASNAHGQQEVAAGEVVEVIAGRAPEPATSRFADVDRVGDESSISTQQLKNRVRALEGQLAAARADTRDAQRSRSDDDDDDRDDWRESLFEPTQAMLERAAKECRVQWASPPPSAHGDVDKLNDEVVRELGLTPQERAAIDALAVELNDDIVALVRTAYVEATGNETDDLSFEVMRSEIFDKATEQVELDARIQISREVAGMADSPSDPASDSPTARMLRAQVQRGQQYSEGLRRILGVDRAREIHPRLPLSVTSMMGCEDDE